MTSSLLGAVATFIIFFGGWMIGKLIYDFVNWFFSLNKEE